MSDEEAITLLTLRRGERGEIRLARARYQGRPFTRLQLFYPAETGELRPGRQVVTIRDSELADVIGVLQKIAAKVGTSERREHRSGPRRMEPDPPAAATAEELELDRRIF